MKVHILHTQFQAALIEWKNHRIVGSPTTRPATPLGGIPFETQHTALMYLPLDLFQRIAPPWIKPPQRNDPLRSQCTQGHIAVSRAKALIVKLLQDLRRKNGHVRVALNKYLFEIPLRVNFAKLRFVLYGPLCTRRIKRIMNAIKGLNEHLSKTVPTILPAGIPKTSMSVKHKYSILHRELPFTWQYPAASLFS